MQRDVCEHREQNKRVTNIRLATLLGHRLRTEIGDLFPNDTGFGFDGNDGLARATAGDEHFKALGISIRDRGPPPLAAPLAATSP